ncbi:hypothetical protein XFF6990_200059 [Xanthomonas citri pv. fuscans]|uniref:Uncharacterized protein n=1 Tax=Xanthomonas campestris pv. phaseoli TaxID=317013 RepID=A0A7Z7NHM7_XANCH|nr:hypothetical protein XFF6990_200059 [Xanthomonas citri pv. fuscans]SOO25309.1 hypothetical protein XFF6991_430133 [Xanthomonas phaseoli pv. phaseoli]
MHAHGSMQVEHGPPPDVPVALRGRPELAVSGRLWKIPGRLSDDPGLSRARRSVARLPLAIVLPPRGRRAGGYGTLPVSHTAGQP